MLDELMVREELRASMPVTDEFAYFDHAAVAPLPAQAKDAISQYAEQSSRYGDVKWLDWAQKLKDLRARCASLLNANTSEIALIPNTTHGINLVSEGLRWRQGENIVIPQNEFPSNSLPWKNLQRLGVEVREVPVGPDEVVSAANLSSYIDSGTRLVSLSWVGFSSGYRVDVAEIVEMSHQKGVLVFLDAIQGLGAFPLDVSKVPIDFVAADGHKWMLGPEGAGFLFVRHEHLERLTPLGIGWNSLEIGAFEPGASQIVSTAARYEGGTVCMASMHGLSASLELLEQCNRSGPDGIAEAILENVDYLIEKLRRADFEIAVPEDPSNRSGIVGVMWPESSSQSLASVRRYLLDAGIVTSVRGGRLRISTHAYNNFDDIDRLEASLTEIRNRS